MSVREQKRKLTEALVMELLLIKSILIKVGREDIVENQTLFVAFINELPNPPKTISGEPFTYMGYRQLMKRFDEKLLREMVEKITSEPDAFLLEA